MTAEPVQSGGAVDSTQELHRIRDIIFGPQMRDYEQRFQLLQRDFERLQQGIDQLTEQVTDQDSDHTKKLQALRREVRQGDDDLRNELRQTANRLADDKVDRRSLGEFFIELGTHLKGGGAVGDVLKDLGISQ